MALFDPMDLQQPALKKKKTVDPYADQYTEPAIDPTKETTYNLTEANRPILTRDPDRGAALDRIAFGTPSDRMASVKANLGFQNQMTPEDTIGIARKIGNPSLGTEVPEMADIPEPPLQLTSNEDPLTRAKAALGERKSPGFWGRLGQGARAFLTGDGIGGFILGLGDTYGKADYDRRLRERAGQFENQDELAFKNQAATLAQRKQQASEIAERNKSDYYEKSLAEAAERETNRDRRDDANRAFQLERDNKRYEDEGKARDARALIEDKKRDIQEARQIIMMLQNSDAPQASKQAILAQISERLGADLPPDLQLLMPNRYGLNKYGLLDKANGTVRQGQDTQGNKFTINISDGRGRGGNNGEPKYTLSYRDEPDPGHQFDQYRNNPFTAKLIPRKKTPYFTTNAGEYFPAVDENGNPIYSAREARKKYLGDK